jgi:predicted Zn finger-like uncharacterized protein
MNVSCPDCSEVYRIDPARIPDGGIRTRCRECGALFFLSADMDGPIGHLVPGARIPRAQPASQAEPVSDPAPGSTWPASPTAAAPAQPEHPERPDPPVQPEQPGRPEQPEQPEQPAATSPQAAVSAGTPASQSVAPAFGPQDPQTRARRLARALVSDVKAYNRDRWVQSRSAGTLRKDFRDDILKSWDEYVEQVGEETAKRTPYFRDALNDLLADGERVF